MEALTALEAGSSNSSIVPITYPTELPPYPSSHPSSHKYPKSYNEYEFVLEGSGTLVGVRLKKKIHLQTRKGGGERNAVNCFSRGSQQRFMFKRAKICWDSIPKCRCFFLRMTFLPPEGSLARPKKCLALFWKRLQAFLGSGGCSGIWKQEYTRNGDWHVHIILVVWKTPRSLARKDRIECDAELPIEFADVLAEWTARTWGNALGWGGDVPYPENSTYCEKVRTLRSALNYLAKGPKHNARWYETHVPANARPDGRWWGVVGMKMFPQRYQTFDITSAEFQEVRKILADVARTRPTGACELPIWSATSPITTVGGVSDGELFGKIKKYVENMRKASEPDPPVQNMHDLLEMAV